MRFPACLPALAGALLLVALASALTLRQPPPAAAAQRLALDVRLARALSVPHIDRARTAAVVYDLRTGKVVYSLRPSLSLAPASTEKLPVSFAALTLLGPDYRIETAVLGEGRRDGATWRGRLVLKGHGDPTLSRARLHALARAVRARGITRVTGRIVSDESFFDGRRTGPGWRSWHTLYCAPLSALAVDSARFNGRTSPRPALAAAIMFRDALRAEGVAVGGSTVVGRAGGGAVPIASSGSPALGALLPRLNRDSDNFAAELLLKHVGATQLERGSSKAGATVVRETLAAAGIPLAGVRIADGSGLSLLDRATATQLTGILVTAWNDPLLRPSFVRSLAVAGRTGTLRFRLRTGPAAARVLAKTGTTRGSSALAGYVGDRYAFAILQNGSPVSHTWARRAQDRFVTVLAGQ